MQIYNANKVFELLFDFLPALACNGCSDRRHEPERVHVPFLGAPDHELKAHSATSTAAFPFR